MCSVHLQIRHDRRPKTENLKHVRTSCATVGFLIYSVFCKKKKNILLSYWKLAPFIGLIGVNVELRENSHFGILKDLLKGCKGDQNLCNKSSHDLGGFTVNEITEMRYLK